MTNHTADDEALFRAGIKRFQARHPGIRVELLNIANGTEYYTKLRTMSVANDLPDVWYVRTADIAFNVANKWQYPLDDYVRKHSAEVDKADFWPAEVTQMTYQGKLYTLPYDFSNYGIYYNKTMFEKEGIPAPTGDWTWKEFFELAGHFVQHKNGKATRWGVSVILSDWFHLGLVQAFGGRLLSEDLRTCTASLPENAEALGLFAEQFANGVAPAAGATPAGVDPFAAGLIAMDINGSWATQIRRLGIGDHFDWDVVELPKGPTGKRAVSTQGGAWGISNDAADKDEAWAFLEFLASEEQDNAFIAKPMRGIPGRQSSAKVFQQTVAASKQPPRNVDAFNRQMQHDTVDIVYPPYWAEFETIWNNRVQALTTGAKPKDVLRQLEDDVNAAAARYFQGGNGR
ncbi:MAG TPA: ABC transporter substrate-binding protein [Mycobacteriales bacterium]|nr:ABC transporter substrate-binding protein [Mycobacteriales bacterium]